MITLINEYRLHTGSHCGKMSLSKKKTQTVTGGIVLASPQVKSQVCILFLMNSNLPSPLTLLAHLEPVLQPRLGRCVNPLKTICAQTIQNLVKVQRKQYA